jgi:diguanylate cyclase (GGDEF)-like protein
MRRRIVVSLLVLVACAASGAAFSALHTRNTTATLRRLIELHQVKELRQQLIITIQTAQSNLYTVNTPFGAKADVITDNVLRLEAAAQGCARCHHVPAVAARLERMNGLVGRYQTALSYYITASADRDRIALLQAEAAQLGSELLGETEQMAVDASRRLDGVTLDAMRRIDEARAILLGTLAVTLLLAIGVAAWLARSVTRPIEALVGATRALASGDLSHRVALSDRTEFGELAEHFNAMGAALAKGYAELQAQIQEREHAEERLLHDAFHDALTGLPNRALFIDRLAQALAATSRRAQPSFAVLFLDLDRFKVVNDTLGHVIGDKLLVAVGERIHGCLRPSDTVARLGGDEFGVLLDDLRGAADAVQISERILEALGRSFRIEGHEIFARASIGAALGSDRYERPEDVLRDADVAMYQAKAKGKSCTVVFDAEMHGSVVARLRLESELRRAVEHGEEFRLHYQPVVELPGGRVVGLEALIRWQPPGRALVHPADFVAIAEESGMILPIGEWAIRAALAQLRAWGERCPALAGATMSVNVSAKQFAQADLVERLQRILGDTGVDPRRVAIEVTESAIIDDVASSAAKLSRLRDMGMGVHVDDFGTGYSSLSYLHRFPITALKIDRSFVSGLDSGEQSEELIRAIVSIADALRFDVIAEGVESPAQLATLNRLRCRHAQGYLFAPPMEPDEVERWASGHARTGGEVAPPLAG